MIALPKDYTWRGVAHASRVLDEAHADSANVIVWSASRADVVARAQGEDLRDRTTLIIEQDWDPRAFALPGIGSSGHFLQLDGDCFCMPGMVNLLLGKEVSYV